MEIRSIFVIIFLACIASACTTGMATQSFSHNERVHEQTIHEGPDIQSLYNPQGAKFCHEYNLSSPFPIAHKYAKSNLQNSQNSSSNITGVEYWISQDTTNSYGRSGVRIIKGTAVFREGGCNGAFIENHPYESRQSWTGDVVWWSDETISTWFLLHIPGVAEFEAQKRRDIWSWKGEVYDEPHIVYQDRFRT